MNINDIHVRYINLDRRTDRNNVTINNLSMIGFNKNNIKRFSAIDGKDLSNNLIKNNYYDDPIVMILKNKNIDYNVGELGCLLSHYFLLKELASDDKLNDDSIIFIFEDDFFINNKYLLSRPFTQIIEQFDNFNNSEDWDLLYFGGRFNVNFIPTNYNLFTLINNNFYLRLDKNLNNRIDCKNFHRTTHNLVIKKKNIYKIIDVIINNFTCDNSTFQYDNLLNSSCNKIKSYDYFPHIFYSPANYTSDIQNIKKKINTTNI